MNTRLRNVGPHLYVAFAVLATATQLRPEGSSIGVAELGLVGSLGLSAIPLIILRTFNLRLASIALASLLVFSIVFFLLGALQSESLGVSNSKAIRDSIALVGAVGGAVVVSVCASSRLDVRNLMITYLVLTVLPLMALLLGDLVGIRFFGIDPWYQEQRFQGWSTNPNQIGLLIAPCLPLSFWLLATSENIVAKGFWIFFAVLTALIGIISYSDALILAWLVVFFSSLVFAAIRNRKSIYSIFGQLKNPSQALAVFFVLTSTLIALSFVESRVLAILEEGNQAGIRMTLWQHCLDAWSMSPWVGLGPGPHSGYISALEEVEAHNTLLDVLSAAGVFGLGVYLLFWIFIFQYVSRSREFWLLAGLFSIFFFSQFHFVIRHPVFWFYVQACLVLSEFSYRDRQQRALGQ